MFLFSVIQWLPLTCKIRVKCLSLVDEPQPGMFWFISPTLHVSLPPAPASTSQQAQMDSQGGRCLQWLHYTWDAYLQYHSFKFGSGSTPHSNELIIYNLGGIRKWFEYFGPCRSPGRQGWSFQLLLSDCPNPGCCSIWGMKIRKKNISHSFSLPHSLSFSLPFPFK